MATAMKKLLVYPVESTLLEILDPDFESFMRHLNDLDGTQNNYIYLLIERAWIGIDTSGNGHFHLTYGGTSGGSKYGNGNLIDPSQNSREEVKYHFYDGHIEKVPKNQLVPAQLARQVAIQFFETGTIPRGLHWEGDMEDYQ